MLNIKNINWLRPAILGANDGIISIASMLVIMIVSEVSTDLMFLAGMATLVAGSMAMATGEYVSVSSHSDALESESITSKLKNTDEHAELANFYITRGLKENTANEIATKLIEYNKLEDNINYKDKTEIILIKPIQAAITSATSYVSGGMIPLLMAVITSHKYLLPVVIISSLFTLGSLGALGAKIGKVKIFKPIIRIVILGTTSLAVSIIVGLLFE